MIDKSQGVFYLVCDCCDEAVGDFDTFEDAVEAKKELGWTSVKEGKEFIDLCPICQKLI